MGNEMGNNNTSAIREEDNISETEKNTLLEDASENANGVSQDVHADGVKEENQNIPTSIARDVTDIDNASKASNDITTELGKDTQQEESHEDDVKEKIQMIPTAEANDSKEKAIWFGSKSTRSMLENDSSEGDAHASEVNMEIQMHPTDEAEDVKEKATGLASEDTTTELGKVTLQEDSHADDVKEKIHMIPNKDVQEKATRLISNNAESTLENDSLEGDTQESDLNIENQKHPTLASDSTRSSLENDSLKGDTHEDVANVDHQENQKAEVKDDQGIAAMLGFDDKTSEHEDKPQEDKQDGNEVIPIANGTDVQGKTTIVASDDPLNLINSSGGAVDEITEIRKPEKSPNAESVEGEGENTESLSSSSFEVTEEYEKKEESYLRKHLSVTHNHHLNNEPSIKQDEEETMVVTLNAVNMSNDSELLESSSVYSDHDELVKFHSERSLQGTESLLKDNLLDTNSHFQQIKEGVLEEEMESQEKNLSTDESHGRDGNELGSGLVDTSGATSDSPSIGNNSNGNLLTMVDYTTEDSLNLLLESFVVDNHEENGKVLHEERKLSRSGSTMENSHDHKPDQCMKDSLKEHKSGMVNTYDMTIESNGERNIALDSSVSGIANNVQVEEPKVIENGLQFDAFVNNSNKASDESSAASEQNHSIVPEAEAVFLIADLIVVDCRHEEEESYKNKIEETNEKQEASYAMVKTLEGTEMSEQCSSDMTKSFTVTSMPNSDWKQTNDGEYFGAAIDKLDSSKATVPSQDLVDDEAFEKEGEDYSQHTEATSAVTMFIDEPCSNNSIFANGGYETRDSITRLSTESNPDNVNISCQMQKSPSFNLNLRIEARREESDQTPLLCQDKSANESLSNQTSPNLINIMPPAEYDQSILEMPVEEKIVTMERSYSEKSKASFIGFLKEEEETHLLVMPETQDNHASTKKPVKEVSSTSPKGKEKRKPRSSFFSSCMCCATVTNPNP